MQKIPNILNFHKWLLQENAHADIPSVGGC